MNMSFVRRRLGVLAVAVAGASLLAGVSSPTQAAPAGLTNWKVYSSHFGPDGEDAPLRYGRGDVSGSSGFGKIHIEERHASQIAGWSTMKIDIDKTLDRGTCKEEGPPKNRKTTCNLRSNTFKNHNAKAMKVIFAHRVDRDSGDGRPVGIITAYYTECGC